jgi:hypothetical protein
LSDKVDALMNMVGSKNTHVDPNDVPLSTLIEQNNDAIDVNFVSRNNFNNNVYRGNFNPRPFPGNSSNNYGNSYNNNNNRITTNLENHIKEFISSQKIFNAMVEENYTKLMIWLGTWIELLMMWKLLKLKFCHLSMILMSQ